MTGLRNWLLVGVWLGGWFWLAYIASEYGAGKVGG